MPRTFRTTTSLVAVTALAMPVPAIAQDTTEETRDEIRLECALSLPDAAATELRDCFLAQLPAYGLEPREEDLDAANYATETPDGAVVDGAAEAEADVSEAEPEQTLDAQTETDVEAAVDAPVAVEPGTPAEAVDAGEPAATAEGTEGGMTADATAETTATEGAQPETVTAEGEGTTEADAPIVTEGTAEAETTATAETAPQADADTAAATEAPAETQTETMSADGAAEGSAGTATGEEPTMDALAAELARRQAEGDGTAVEGGSDTTASTGTVDATTDTTAATDAETMQPEATAEAGSDATADGEGTVSASSDPAEVNPVQSDVAEEVAAQPEPELTEEEQVARDQTEAALANLESEGSAMAAAAASDAEGTVQEETVSADDVRSSDEDFTTSAVETERDDDDDDGGLSRTRKIALGALGALAVGTLLNNRSRVISNSGDRVVVQREDGNLTVLKDDDALLRQAGSNVRTESFDDGSTRTIVSREDGSQVITVRDASLRVLRRVLVRTDGTEVTLIDDTAPVEPVDVSTLPPVNPAVVSTRTGDDPLRAALLRDLGGERRYTLAQVRTIPQVRALAPAYEVNTVTFASGSAAIAPEQAGNLTDLARDVLNGIQNDPRKVFLIEGHTDAVGDAAYNLALSDRRAESLALALNEYFQVPVENMVVQGYGEQYLKVATQSAEQANRRATVRDVTGLLQTAAAN